MIVIGIDPGLDGGIAAVGCSPVVCNPILNDIPTLTRKKSKGIKREYDIAGMRAILMDFKRIGIELSCALEDVHAMPGQGVTSMFSMGQGVGIWKGLLSGLEIPFELISPQRWKGAMLNGTGKDKEASRLKAMQLFPKIADKLSLKKDHGKAEALLLAEYYKRQLR